MNTTDRWYHVDVEGQDTLKCTAEHPFYVVGKGFVPAKDLQVGDNCLLANGKEAIINRLEVEHLSEPETTYNFEVADFHTYFVGKQGVLVHNTCVKSRIHESDALVKEANSLNGRVQSEANDLVNQFANGNTNPGIGSKNLSGDIYYLRGRNGARVFYNYDATNDVMYLLGKASKANESRVISLVLKTFGG